jgi:predicted nucleic acid-binding protein
MDLKKKEKELSIPDCIGFVIAKRLGAKFLTGDKAFEKKENVEFVK